MDMLDALGKVGSIADLLDQMKPRIEQEIAVLPPGQQKIGTGIIMLLKALSKQRVVAEAVPEINQGVTMCPQCGAVHVIDQRHNRRS